ncbi:TetR/AcrR family transcriptional regulator [Phenylobacterium kunshanense]|uniref:TetR/AcrR family transcriptional regulator n=1 Tax=Phenylobacterium kunshanense TaxID=1445034 RepID=A0A328BBC3_9CAUL|nr:TetR/AcrR family transcriptional regulator [Phenylobacterium kunshanense]RAK63044.1 TetR/AcrR family transcriptional regulator [Phenylobacterium kunshanense]
MARADGQSGGAIRGRRRKGEGPDLRQAILDSAEALFSKHGFYGVTVRQVAAEAGVDTALIHYYFGAKRELFDSVFARRAEILNDERIAAMRAYADAHPGAMTAEGIIEAFIGPLVERSLTNDEGWKNYFRLVALVNNTPAWGGETMHRFFDPVVRQLIDMFKLALPGAELRDLYWGYQFLTGAMMLTLSETGRIDQLSDGLCRSTDLEAVKARLYAWCAAGLEVIVERRVPA